MHFRAQKKLNAEVSMNDTIDVDRDGNPLTYTDVISSDENLSEDVMRRVEAERAMTLVHRRLDQREKQIITLRFGLDGSPALTQREIAMKLGISRSYVSRIEKTAIQKLREGFGLTN
jgi:RNA polymerase sporulation-specific sigma factor